MEAAVETVNALKIRNHLGEVLDRLDKRGEPILISKGRKIRAVLVTVEDFERRFLDVRAREERLRFLDRVRSLRRPARSSLGSLDVLRSVRGYEE
jgi:prevent-host-death family protein